MAGIREFQELPFHVYTDQEVRRSLRAEDAVAWMREAVIAERDGQLISPARINADIGEGRIVMTAGSTRDRSYGYRVYDTLGLPESQQVVVAHDAGSGAVRAIAVGSEIGLRSTAALGGVAHDALAPHKRITVALIGSGRQAQGQLWALAAVREIGEVRLYSRDAERREAVAEHLDANHPFPVRPVGSPQEAVNHADVVVLATTSATPVIRTEWLEADTYVATVGPKQVSRAEFGEDLLRAAAVITTDSLAQLGAYDPPAVAAQPGIAVAPLGDLVESPPPAEGIRVYLSVGLAGTEPHLLHRLAQSRT